MAIPKQRTGKDSKGRDNYNTSSSQWDGGKGSIQRDELVKDAYADNWERIFGKKEKEVNK